MEINDKLLNDGAFVITMKHTDSIDDAVSLAIKTIHNSSKRWQDHVLRKYNFFLYPNDSSYGPPSFSASLQVVKKEYPMPWETPEEGKEKRGGPARYRVLERSTGKSITNIYPNCLYALTPDGKVVWWDESQGWIEDEQQDRWSVVFYR